MASSLFSRVQKIVSAGVEEVVSSAERASSLSLMRQAIRDAEAAVERHQQAIAAARREQDRLAGAERVTRDDIRKLGENARYALEKGRDDLARVAVAQQIELERQLADHARARNAAEQAAATAADAVREAAPRLERMRGELAAVEKARAAMGEASTHADGGPTLAPKLDRAEAAFERAARTAAAQFGASTDEPELEEIRTLRVEDEIAARLASLKARPAATRRSSRKPTPKRTARKA